MDSGFPEASNLTMVTRKSAGVPRPPFASKEDLSKRIDFAKNYDELFELVKRIVEMQIGRHRAGLSLVLQDMPSAVGAYYPLGTNVIVVNRSLIRAMDKVVPTQAEVNEFVFMVLMHEYLHSLGYLAEDLVRRKCQEICAAALGATHPTVRLATSNWLQAHPELQMSGQSFSRKFESVDKFDSSSTSYIG